MKRAEPIKAQDHIVVTIPASRLAAVEEEEREVARRTAAGEEPAFYWTLPRLPKVPPRRIYFVWDGAVRAYHDVIAVSHREGRIYMRPEIHELAVPVSMKGFQGFRYFEAPNG